MAAEAGTADPVGLYSQAAYNKWQGLPSDIPEESVQQAVTEAVEKQLEYLTAGDFDSYADTVDINYFSNGTTKDAVIQEMRDTYPEGTIQSLTDSGIAIYQTTDDSGETLYLYSAVRRIVKTDGTAEEISVQETYRNTADGILMYGAHSRFLRHPMNLNWPHPHRVWKEQQKKNTLYIFRTDTLKATNIILQYTFCISSTVITHPI